MRLTHILVLAVVLPFAGIDAGAQTTNRWATGLSGKWELATNWTVNLAPTNNSFVFVTNATTKTVTLNATTVLSNSTMTVSNLTLSAPAGSTNILLLSDPGTNTPLRIGNTLTISSGGSLVISNGAVHSDGTTAFANDGQLLLNSSNAWLIVTNKNTAVGATGVGQMTVSNGSVLGKVLFVANSAGSRGTLTIAGGFIRLSDVLFVSNSPNATGAVWMTGGQLIVTNFSTSIGGTAVGQMTLSNGAATILSMTVGANAGSQGTFTIAGGTNIVKSSLTIANQASSTGAAWVIGGRLVVTNSTTSVGASGSGQMTVSNGVFLANVLQVGTNVTGRGTLTIAGGTTTANSSFIVAGDGAATGTVWMTGGRLNVSNSTSFVGQLGTGRFTLSNGTWAARDVQVGGTGSGARGTLTITGGTITLSQTMVLASAHSATGEVWMSGGRLDVPITISVGQFGTGQLTVSNGIVNSLVTAVAAGFGSRGTLTVAGGTANVFTSLTIGTEDCGSTGRVVVAGGSLFVTNATGSAVLDVFSGTLQLNSGTITVDKIVITNTCSQFVRTGGTLIYGTADLNPAGDADGDGLPNSWEQQYGLDPLSDVGNNGDSGDPDGDGVTNLQEYQLGTDPTDRNSPVRITAIAREGDDIRITWTTIGGTTNRVQFSPGAAGGNYSNNFSNISGPLIISGSGLTSTNYLESGGATNRPARYYTILLTSTPPLPPFGPEYFFTSNLLLPTNGVYITPLTPLFAQYGMQYLIRNMQLRNFTQSLPPPPLGGTQFQNFSAVADFEISFDGGTTYQPSTNSVSGMVRITHTSDAGVISYFDTEMLSLNISGGGLPVGVMVRESPALPSNGKTSVGAVPGGYMISSFFDVFTELSVDGGSTWTPSVSSGRIELRNDPPAP